MSQYLKNPKIGDNLLPVDIVLAPEWWSKHENITFDRDYFFHPVRRIEDEQKMEKALYERWGKFGLGEKNPETRPEIGAVHLAAGFLLSEMMGCQVIYSDNHPPNVISQNREDLLLDHDAAFSSRSFKDFESFLEKLKKKYGYLCGDVNWSGILNLAMDLRGENIFIDMITQPDDTKNYFNTIQNIITKFVKGIQPQTGSSSISVNRNVRNIPKPVFLHSECSHTMISSSDYENYLLPFDISWSQQFRPFGIHYCGVDPHRHVESFSQIPNLDFFDVGWGGDVKTLREYLPNTFLNIRLSPVEIATQTVEEIRTVITDLVHASGNPYLTGVCCINMDEKVTDEKITAIFDTVEVLRKSF